MPDVGMLLASEIVETRSVEHLALTVAAPSGQVKITHVCKTKPMPVWRVTTCRHELICASKHLVVTARGPVSADQVKPGDMVITQDGELPVVESSATGHLQEMFDLRVDSADHLYFTEGIASHNSTGLGAAELFQLNVVNNYRSIYIAPLKDHIKTFADKLMDMQRGSIYPPAYITSKGLRNNMYYKESPKGGFLRLMHILTDPTKIRGLSANAIRVDECLSANTTISTKNGGLKTIADIEAGEIIVAFDEHNCTRLDRVLRLHPKGKRHTWRIRTRNGRSLEATGNERLWTPTGWRYLAEFVTESAASICPVSSEVKRTRRGCLRHDHGDSSGGRELLNDSWCVPSLQGRSLSSAGGLLSDQTGPAAGLHVDEQGAGSGEQRVGDYNVSILDVDVTDLRILTLPVLRCGQLEAGGVAVSGRRRDTGAADGVCGALVHAGGSSQTGGVHETSGDGLPGAPQAAGDLEVDEIVSIEYAGLQEVYDIETEKHHTFFADGFAVHNCQDFDPDHLPEIEQVQKSFASTKSTVFAGTSKDLDTCLEAQYQLGSRGVWHIPCTCKDKWHALNDVEALPAMMSVDGLRCPHNASRLLNPMSGRFVHESNHLLELNRVSFHLPQVIVPEYASGAAFYQIWMDFKRYPFKKFLQEVMGIAVDAGMAELTEADLKKCCGEKTFAQLQDDYFKKRTRYIKLFSGCDWGGSDWNPASRTKQSYTVHTIYGMLGDGRVVLLYAKRYAGMHYQEIIGEIVAQHNRFGCFAIGTDNGGGQYYNAQLRDCGRIPTDKIINFQYTDTKMFLERIAHPDANLMSLHRSDSISALIADVKSQKILFPRWDDCEGFVTDFLNVRRNITETTSGRTIMRFIRHGSKADDFMQSTNYAVMMKRIHNQESTIPNRQILRELGQMFGTVVRDPSGADIFQQMGGYISG